MRATVPRVEQTELTHRCLTSRPLLASRVVPHPQSKAYHDVDPRPIEMGSTGDGFVDLGALSVDDVTWEGNQGKCKANRSPATPTRAQAGRTCEPITLTRLGR